METAPVPRRATAVLPLRDEPQGADDEDIPLGWESANPALQIERWGLDDEVLSGKS